MKVQLRAALALLSSAAAGAGAMAMDYAPLQCNVDAVPPVESMDCLAAAAPLSALVASHGSSAMPLTVPCGTCVVVDQVDGSAVTVPGGINVLGRLHFPPSANVVIETTAVFVQGVLSAEEPSVGNKVRVTLYGSDDVTFYPHEECCSGAAADHRGLLRASGGGGGGGGRDLMQNGCDAECAYKKNVSMKPIVVAGGKLDIRAVDPACASWTVLSDVRSVDPPPIASGCRPDGSLLRGDGTFESGTVSAGMTGGALATETTADGAANGFYRVSNRAFEHHGVFVEMDAACAIPGRRYRFAAKHRLENGAMDDEFLGTIAYQKPGRDWVMKHFMLCKNRVPGPNEWSEPCHDDFLIDEDVAGAVKIKVEYFPTNQDRSVDISFDDVRMDLVYDPLVAGLETSSEFASCLDIGDEVVVTSSSTGDQAFEGHQIFTVASVDPASGAFDFNGQRMYQTFPTLSGPGEPVYAAEVARLTRRFVFDARNDGPDPLHGGHFVVMHTPDVVQTVSGLEVRNFGQQGRLGRYPVHFHMSGDVSGSVVSRELTRMILDPKTVSPRTTTMNASSPIGGEPQRQHHVVYAAGGSMLTGLFASVCSLVENTASPEAIFVHVFRLDDGFQTDGAAGFEELSKRVEARGARFKLHNYAYEEVAPYINNSLEKHSARLADPSNYVRFILARRLPSDAESCLWIDSDTIVQGDVAPVMTSFDPSNKAIAAFPRRKTDLSKGALATLKARGVNVSPHHRPSFNAGIMIFSLRLWRDRKVDDQIRQICEINDNLSLWPRYGSQAPLQVLFSGARFQRLDLGLMVEGLGWHRSVRPLAIESATFLHWNGDRKPWRKDGLSKKYWEKYRYDA